MYCAGAQNLASRNSPPDPAKVADGPQLATPLPRARGKDDVSSKETASNYMNRGLQGRGFGPAPESWNMYKYVYLCIGFAISFC